MVTAGGLLFVGRSDGRLTALDKSNGAKLWEFMTDAGVNTTVTTFEHKGRQMVVVHAGGGMFANGKRGDGVWMFSLDGTIESMQPAAPAGGAPRGPPAAASARAINLQNGEKIYRQACLPCHGETGESGHGGGKPLVGVGLSHEAIVATTTTGKNNMPAFATSYSADDIRDVSRYVLDVLGRKK